jgi:hypothetical protein
MLHGFSPRHGPFSHPATLPFMAFHPMSAYHALIYVASVICDLAGRPTHVSKLVQEQLAHIGLCDTSAFGAGGVWFGGGTPIWTPSFGAFKWPKDLTKAVLLILTWDSRPVWDSSPVTRIGTHTARRTFTSSQETDIAEPQTDGLTQLPTTTESADSR